MAVRTDADGEDYTRALALGVQSALTLCGWFRLAVDRNTWQTIFSVDNGTGDNWLMQTGDDGITMNSVFDATTQASMGALTLNTWYFICLATSGTTGNIYYRTAAQSALTSVPVTGATASVNAATLRIGESPWGSEWWSGDFANISLWLAQLSAAEVLQESTRYVPYRYANLAAWYPLVRPETVDYSGNARTLSGGAGASIVDGPPIPWYTTTRPRIVLPASGGGGTPINVTLNRATETDSANVLVRSKTIPLVRATESDLGRLLSRSKSALLSRATETDLGRALTRSKTVNFLRATEIDTARTLTPSHTVSLSRATETSSARSLTKHTLWILLRATETESARSLNVARNIVLGRAVEIDTARALSSGQPIHVTLSRAVETSVGRALTRSKLVILNRSIETDTSRSLIVAHHLVLGRALSTDIARNLGVSRAVLLPRAVETDVAHSFALQKVVQLVRAIETGTARNVTLPDDVGRIDVGHGSAVNIVDAEYGAQVQLVTTSYGLVVVTIASGPGERT